MTPPRRLEWLTLSEYAHLTGETYDAVAKQRQRGTLPVPARRKGRLWVVYFVDLQAGASDLWASIVEVSRMKNRGKS